MCRGNSGIAKVLQEARTGQGLSQRELSQRSGLTQAQISRIENGAVDMRISSLIALANELGLELNFTSHHPHPPTDGEDGPRKVRRRRQKGSVVYGFSETPSQPGIFGDIAEELL